MEEAGAYERWFHIKVRTSRGDPHPSILHDHMMADTEAIIRAAGQQRSALRYCKCVGRKPRSDVV